MLSVAMMTVSKKANKPDPWALALRMLKRRDHGVAELTRKLQEKAVSAEAIEQVVARCRDCGYLDDDRYAAARARSLMRSGRAVGNRILIDLKQRGIDEQVACRALQEAREELDDDTVLSDLLERRFPGFDYPTADDRERRRVIHFLQRRGFSLNGILQKLNRKGS